MQTENREAIQHEANQTLREAITQERSKRWNQVVHSYKRLLEILKDEQFSADNEINSMFRTLRYECEYHLGIALQHLKKDRKAAFHYSKAIEAVFVPKNGCVAGCSANSCLMTPVHARRAFAYGRLGDLRSALKDAEKAVVLDSKNPDVFCIRALVRSTRNEEKEALGDLNYALELNPNHVCSLLLRGSIEKPKKEIDWATGKEKILKSLDHIKACNLNADCHLFLGVKNFHHPEMMKFYDRLLYSLGVPHTMSEIPFKNTRPMSAVSSICSGSRSRSSTPTNQATRKTTTPFRCGTPHQFISDQATQQRRTHYSATIREKFITYNKQQDYIAGFLKATRPISAGSRRENDNDEFGTNTRKVFQAINIKDAPRMYYRPWLGDKLPVAEITKRTEIHPPFRV